MPNSQKILSHDLETPGDLVQIRQIAHKNHYDFLKLHRHNYFEVMFFQQGGGENLIDLVKYAVKSNGCYIIYPGQTHLLNRAPGSSGFLIQFKLESIISIPLQRLLQERAWSGVGAVVFEENIESMKKMTAYVQLLQELINTKSSFWKESQQYLLQSLLFELCAHGKEDTSNQPLESDFYLFQQLVDEHFKQVQSVGYYLEKLAINEKRLASLTRSHLGISPLQLIHGRVLLEAKRLLVFGSMAHKEIAFELGFDSPASFSAFIKKKTGLNPSEIQMQMAEIHK